MRPFLDKAVARDANRSIIEVWRALMVGEMDAWVIDGEAQGYVVTSESDEADGRTFWINYCGGMVDGGPKRRAETYRRVADNFEAIAQQLGIHNVRFGGRDWSCLDGFVVDGDERKKVI